MPPLRPKADVVDPICALILANTQVASEFGEEALAFEGRPPRYVWVPASSPFSGASNVGGSPRSLVDVAATFNVHCWAESYDDAWQLVRALVTAVHECLVASGRADSFEPTPSDTAVKGCVLVVPVVLTLPLHEVPLDTPASVVAVPTVAAFANSTEVDGDGRLIAPLR